MSIGIALGTQLGNSAGGALGGIPRANLLAEYRFNEGSGQRSYNRANPSPTPPNLFAAPEQMFANSPGPWAQASLTITEYFATDPLGNNNATRIVGGAGGSHTLTRAITLAAGTYTISLWVKSNTGSPQLFRMAIGAFSSDITIPTTWTRVSFTDTVTAGAKTTYIICQPSTGAAMDFLIYGAQLEAGAVATTYAAQTGDLVLGTSALADSADPAWTSRGLDFVGSGAASALGAFSVPGSANTMTIYLTARSTGTAAAYAYFLREKFSASPFTFELFANYQPTGEPRWHYGGGTLDTYMTDIINDNTTHLLAFVYDGVALRCYLDGFETDGKQQSGLGTIAIRQLSLSGADGASGFPGDMSHLAIYTTGHDLATVRSTMARIRALLAPRPITFQTPTKYLVHEGDSISDSGASGSQAPGRGFVYIGTRSLLATVRARNCASSGAQLVATLTPRAGVVDALWSATNAVNVFSLLIGRNDFNVGTITAAQEIANIKAYCLARKAAALAVGVTLKILLCTLLPSTAGGYNTWRNTVNTGLRADTSFYDGLCDFALDATMGPDAAAADTNLYSDGTHPTLLGQTTYLTPVYAAALAALL